MRAEAFEKVLAEWHRKRGELRNILELVPIAVREDDGNASELARLLFDHETHRFVDPDKRVTTGENVWENADGC